MSEKEQTERFARDVDNLVERYRSEYDLSYASIVGVLQIKVHLMCDEMLNHDDEEET